MTQSACIFCLQWTRIILLIKEREAEAEGGHSVNEKSIMLM